MQEEATDSKDCDVGRIKVTEPEYVKSVIESDYVEYGIGEGSQAN